MLVWKFPECPKIALSILSHKFYLPDGTHCATSKVTGVWIDMMLRKMTTPPDDILVSLLKYKTDQTELLTKEDLKKLSNRPENIDPSVFK